MIPLRAPHQYPGGSWPGCIFLEGLLSRLPSRLAPALIPRPSEISVVSLPKWSLINLTVLSKKEIADTLSAAASNEEVSSEGKGIFCS